MQSHLNAPTFRNFKRKAIANSRLRGKLAFVFFSSIILLIKKKLVETSSDEESLDNSSRNLPSTSTFVQTGQTTTAKYDPIKHKNSITSLTVSLATSNDDDDDSIYEESNNVEEIHQGSSSSLSFPTNAAVPSTSTGITTNGK